MSTIVCFETVAQHFLLDRKSSIIGLVNCLNLKYRANKTSNDLIALRNNTFKDINNRTDVEYKDFLVGLTKIFRLQYKK